MPCVLAARDLRLMKSSWLTRAEVPRSPEGGAAYRRAARLSTAQSATRAETNVGLKAAVNEIVLVTDDDCTLDSGRSATPWLLLRDDPE
jgi:hypothetical protein